MRVELVLIFFFKQKTAYEIMPSPGGPERWIRDSRHTAAETGGVPAVIREIEKHDAPETRRGLFSLAFGKLSKEEWSGRSLDATLEIARGAIAEGLSRIHN